MSRPSRIDQLPAAVRDALHGWLRDPAITQTEATHRLNLLLDDLGEPRRINRHAVNRYDLRMRKVGERLRERRQVAEAWIARLGSEPGGQLGHLVTELVRGLAFDFSLQMEASAVDPESLPAAIETAGKLALMAQRIERASFESTQREEQIRQAERARAAEQADKSLTRQGLSQGAIDTIKRDILGVRA